MTKSQIVDQVTEILGDTHRGDSPPDLDEINAAARKIVELMAPDPDPSTAVPLSKFVGELIELRLRYGCGTSVVCGRVLLVEGGFDHPACFWIGDSHFPIDAILYHASVGNEWIFDAEKYDEDKNKARLFPYQQEMIDKIADQSGLNESLFVPSGLGKPNVPEEAVVAQIHDETIVDGAKYDMSAVKEVAEVVAEPVRGDICNRGLLEHEDTPNARPLTVEQYKEQVREAMDYRR